MNDNNQPVVSDGLKIGVIIGTVFFPLIGIILGIVFFVDANPEKKAVGKLWLTVGCIMLIIPCICTILALFVPACGGIIAAAAQ